MKFTKISLAASALALIATSANADSRILVEYGNTETVSSGISGIDWSGPYPNGNTGGAIENYGTVNIANGLTFSGNKAGSGGAVYSSSDSTQGYPPSTTSIGDNVIFSHNAATGDPNGGGGAIYIMGVNTPSSLTVGANAEFTGNSSDEWGGAFYLQDVIATIGDGAIFNNNSAGRHGGAIFAYNYSTTSGSVAIGSNASFTNNSASSNGGAIANYYSEFNFSSGASFSGNGATLNGGAIFNASGSSMTFNGDATFSNNMAGGVLNDIYNAGTLNFLGGGTITLDGGIAGASGSSITFGDNTTLKAKLMMTPSISADTITIGSGSTISNLVIGAHVSGNNLELWEIANATGTFTYTGPESNLLYNIAQNPDGTFNVSQTSLDIPGATSNQLAALTGLMSGTSANSDFNTIAHNISALIQSDNQLEVAAGLAAAQALAPPSAPQAQSVSTQTSAQVFDAVGARFSGGSVSAMGQSSGDLDVGGGAFWAQGLTNKAKLTGDDGFTSDSNGFALGIETNMTSSTKLGIGYAYTHSKVKPYTDSKAVPHIGETKIQSNTALLYGEYRPTDWFLNVVASYTFGDYSSRKNIAGVHVSGDYNTNTLAAQALTGYEFRGRNLSTTPQAGLRYINVQQEGYTDSTGSYTNEMNSDYLTGIAGLKLSYGSRIMPELYLGATYDMITSDANASMVMANGAVVNVAGSALPRAAVEAGAGITLSYDVVDLTIGYMGRFRENYTDNTGLLSFKYKF
ncbi:MAG: autotransporter domain-containing protein [Alphaproteobacteria bacterium]|nr:autotransporter domain-containing protein [Alphaproteobacteria bacterium]